MKTEWEMVLDCKSYFEKKSNYQKVACEIPFLSRCIDMVLIDNQNEVITIEFKLTKWRDAILQAYDHMRGADYAYVCMPERKPSEELISQLNSKGIGLLLYNESAEEDEKVRVFLEAPRSTRRVQAFSDNLIHTVDLCCVQ